MSAEQEYTELRQRLQTDKSSHGQDNLRDFLRLARELKIRDPEVASAYGLELLASHGRSLGAEERWLLHEQVSVACLDVGRFKEASDLINALNKQFPDSVRARRLQGMYFEALGRWDEAATVYKELLQEQPANDQALKRLVALERSRGDLVKAADALRRHLDNFSGDAEGWEELADIYTELGAYRQAAFCYEELLLMAPLAVNNLTRYADVLYTLGGPQNYRTARSYYSKVVQLTGGSHLRSLYGLLACCAQLGEPSGSKAAARAGGTTGGAGAAAQQAAAAAKAQVERELPEAAAKAILDIYASSAPDKSAAVSTLLQRMGFSSAAASS